MKGDPELEMWKHYWKAQPSVPMDLFRKVEKENRSLRHYGTAEILVTVFVGGGTVAAALVMRSPAWLLLACGAWLFIIVAWGFSLRYTKGIWAPGAPTMAAYLDLSIRRCQSRMKAASYDIIQSILITAFALTVDYYLLLEWDDKPPSMWLLVLFVFALVLPLVAGFEWSRRKARTELNSLVHLQQQLEQDN
jgi:hypothetical protein